MRRRGRTMQVVLAAPLSDTGIVRDVARAGVPEAQIMAQTGHRSLPVLR
jgi:hypothetical protein